MLAYLKLKYVSDGPSFTFITASPVLSNLANPTIIGPGRPSSAPTEKVTNPSC